MSRLGILRLRTSISSVICYLLKASTSPFAIFQKPGKEFERELWLKTSSSQSLNNTSYNRKKQKNVLHFNNIDSSPQERGPKEKGLI